MQLSAGARYDDYIASLAELHGRFVARARVLHEMEGVTWSDAWIDEHWPMFIEYDDDEAPYFSAENAYVNWALKFDVNDLDGVRFDAPTRWIMATPPRLTPSPTTLLRVIAAAVTANPAMLGYWGYYPATGEYDWDKNPLWGATEHEARRGFVHPETRELLTNDPWKRMFILESLIGAPLPGVEIPGHRPPPNAREVATLSVRRGDARVLNWLHRAMDALYLVKIPQYALNCSIPGSFHDGARSYQPTSTFRQYDIDQARDGFVWPWYHPDPGGGVLRTTYEPAPVQVEQRAWRAWENPSAGMYPDPWADLASRGEVLVSGDETHGWYYRYDDPDYNWYSRSLPLPPLDRRHAVWRQYTLLEDGQYRRYAEIERSWYRSTLVDMPKWPEVSDLVRYWDWRVRCSHHYYGLVPITFRFETAAESHSITVHPGEQKEDTLRFTTSPVQIYIDGQTPSQSPFAHPWLRQPWHYMEASSFCNIEQEPAPTVYRDIRPRIGESTA